MKTDDVTLRALEAIVRQTITSRCRSRTLNLAIGPEMAAAFAVHADSIARSLKAAGEGGRENIDKASAAEARGEW